MRSIWIIAINTFREIVRDRILYGIMVFAVLMIGLSLALGQLSFAEQMRITTSFGLTAIQLSSVILSIFLGSSLVFREIEKKTIMTLLVRPISRLQFLIGKCFGLMMVQLLVITMLAVVLIGIYLGIGVELKPVILVALHGIVLEALVLLGVSLFFSIFATPMMVVAFSMGVFLIGHWLDSLRFFTGKRNDFYRQMGESLTQVLPNLEHFNWRSAVIYDDVIGWERVAMATGYSLAWFTFLVIVAGFIFRRRDFA